MNEKPNVLIIMADQFRLASITNMGDGIETPNIDRIRKGGTLFERTVCTSPLCVPSRASLATAKYPHRCGVIHPNDNLSPNEKTYYQIFREKGYRVGLIGKTDLHKSLSPCDGESPFYTGIRGDLPIMYQFGFTESCETEGKMNSAYPHYDHEGKQTPNGPYQSYLLEKNPELLRRHTEIFKRYMLSNKTYYAEPTTLAPEDTLDAFIGRKACEYLYSVEKNIPWHLLVSFAGPHNPWDPPVQYVDMIDDTKLTLPPKDSLEDKPMWIRNRAEKQSAGITEKDLLNTKKHYAAAVKAIDAYIGEILDTLEEEGFLHNTIIVFCADHGEFMGEHGLFEKTAMYEGALRIPFIVNIPGIEQPYTSSALVELIDIVPTIFQLCSISYDLDSLDAKSLLPLFTKNQEEIRNFQYSELESTYMLCDRRYKWIHSYNDTDELYDLKEDPDELKNIIREHPEIVKAFKELKRTQFAVNRNNVIFQT